MPVCLHLASGPIPNKYRGKLPTAYCLLWFPGYASPTASVLEHLNPHCFRALYTFDGQLLHHPGACILCVHPIVMAAKYGIAGSSASTSGRTSSVAFIDLNAEIFARM